MKILTIDGGGVFGIIPAYFCSKMDISKFDAFAGTSVGSILTLSYACGKTSQYVFDQFNTDVYNIFSSKEKKWINIKGVKFKDSKLNETLKKMIDRKYGEMVKPIFTTAFDIVYNKPKIFDNIKNTPDLAIDGWEVARSSCAAPTYFSVWNGYIDGGVVANNPSIIAAWGLLSKLGIGFEDMEILSLGTGWTPPRGWTTKEINSWWTWQWLSPIIDIAVDTNKNTFHFGCQQMPFKKYVRFNEICLPDGYDFTDPKHNEKILQWCKNSESKFMEVYEDFMK